MTIIISFLAALRAGDTAARMFAALIGFASFIALFGVMLYHRDNRIRADVIQKIERANDTSKSAADQAGIKRLKCTGVWNREKQTCE